MTTNLQKAAADAQREGQTHEANKAYQWAAESYALAARLYRELGERSLSRQCTDGWARCEARHTD